METIVSGESSFFSDLSDVDLMEGPNQLPGPEVIASNQSPSVSELPLEIDPEIAHLLGDIPSGKEVIFGKPVLQALADRWEKYLVLGIDKSDKEDLQKKFPPPKNIPLLRAPTLNPELESSVPDYSKKSDKYLATMQNHLGTGLTALGEVINKILTPDSPISDIKTDILPQVVAAGKLVCGVFHMLTTNRKYGLEGHLNSTVKKLVRESSPDEFLCGKGFADRYKEVKAQWRTGRDMKKFSSPAAAVKKSNPYWGFSSQQNTSVASTSKVEDGSLNFQRGVQKFKMKGKYHQRGDRPYRPERSEKRGTIHYSNRRK